MEYKVSYQKNIGPDGTVYDQCINATMTCHELSLHNAVVANRKKEINAQKVKHHDDVNFMCFVRLLLRGKNHTTITQRKFFVSHFKLEDDKRILNRNTLIIVNLKK